MTWRSELDGARWVPVAVVPEMDDVWDRARSITDAPLEYVGAGGSAVVLRDGDRVLKVGRARHPIYFSMLEEEGELLEAAHAIDPAHVVRPHAFLAEPVVLIKDYVEGKAYGWGTHELHDHFQALALELQKVDWGAPEYKDDSYVKTDEGFVLVDGGHAQRLCMRLLTWVEEWLDGKRHPWTAGMFDKEFVSFLVRREVNEGCVPRDIAEPVLQRLGGFAENPSYVSWIVYEAGPKGQIQEWDPATYEAAERLYEMFKFQARHEPHRIFGFRRSKKKPLLELSDGIVQRIKRPTRQRLEEVDRALCGCTAGEACDACRAKGKKW